MLATWRVNACRNSGPVERTETVAPRSQLDIENTRLIVVMV